MSMPANFAFFGTDEFSVRVLDGLKERGLAPSLVVTVPDRPKGRKLVLTPPPAKAWAEQNGIPVIQPASLRGEIPEALRGKFDFFLVASYGKIIPQAILGLPKHGALNIHPSLLPLYRGATPLESAILAGDERTGISIMKLDAEMDHGPILGQATIKLGGWDPYYEELRDRAALEGAKLLADLLPPYLAGKLAPEEQNHALATYTKKIEKEDGLINFEGKPELSYRKIRAFTPWPGAYFFVKKNDRDIRVIVKKARLEDGELKIEKVVPEGKSEMDWESFKRGYLKI